MHPHPKPPIEWARPLIFAWPSGQPFYFILPAMIFLAAMLHLLALGLVRLIYPEPGESRLAPAHLVVLPNDEGFWQSQSSWIAAADPSLFSPARVEATPALADISTPFEPSFLVGSLRWLAPEEDQERFTPALLPTRHVSVRPLPTDLSSQATPGPRPSPPEVSWRVIGENQPQWPLPAALSELSLPGLPAVFLVEVDSEGLPNYIFLETSSGSAEWDSAAEAALRAHCIPSVTEPVWLRMAVGPGTQPPAFLPEEPSLSIP